jgi:hypothetical protein
VATLEEAKAQFQKGWDAWKACAKLCGRHDGLGNDFIGGRFGDASAQSKEATDAALARFNLYAARLGFEAQNARRQDNPIRFSPRSRPPEMPLRHR